MHCTPFGSSNSNIFFVVRFSDWGFRATTTKHFRNRILSFSVVWDFSVWVKSVIPENSTSYRCVGWITPQYNLLPLPGAILALDVTNGGTQSNRMLFHVLAPLTEARLHSLFDNRADAN